MKPSIIAASFLVLAKFSSILSKFRFFIFTICVNLLFILADYRVFALRASRYYADFYARDLLDAFDKSLCVCG